MVNYSPTLDNTFGALSHPIRRQVLARLTQGEATISELAGPLGFALPAMLKHIRLLEKGGLLVSQKTGRVHICRLNAAPLQDAAEWLAFYKKFWNQKLDALGTFLEESDDSNDR